MLEQAGARVLMAGDTHAFEYYLKEVAEGGTPRHYFVNGGGGAYLSIGGALAWPDVVPAEARAFYPSGDAIRAKLDAETPLWKQPFWLWIKRFGAWPISIETLSGMFDFNRAPFYQSFMDVRVERSKNRVILPFMVLADPYAGATSRCLRKRRQAESLTTPPSSWPRWNWRRGADHR